MSNIYFLALRPWSFSASLIPVLLGNVLAYKKELFSFVLLLLCIICVIAIHSGGNLINTYYDYINGVDKETSDDKTLVKNLLAPSTVFKMSMIAYAIGCIALTLIVILSKASYKLLTMLFFIGVIGSFAYTGGIALKYVALGDVLIMLLFGPLSVVSPYAVQTGELAWIPVLFSIPIVLHTEAILHSNNSRDREDDSNAGVVTLALLLGEYHSYIVYVGLIFLPYICCLALGTQVSMCFFLVFSTIPIAYKLERKFSMHDLNVLPQETAKLNLLFGLLYVVASLF